MGSPLEITSRPSIHGVLESVFAFPAFRPNQQEVCEAAVDGHDLLLVMPTGAGKSLCYQLPALARGGTALVISPLIALMDDQTAKLRTLGLRVARIHSGLDRAESRQACVNYLSGKLQFLFIAPERLRVPGFPEMLAKRRLALIAIDEAHCISQWGHDFRPDYRTLGQYLPALRGAHDPSPVLAMTATATPAVQADIVAQLELNRPKLFIHGFRRGNLAIEVVELPMPERPAVIAKLLGRKENRPAIVYTTARKQAESLAQNLSQAGIAAAAYHAGLDGETRERVQNAFLCGEVEVVVATIAFGMGIDKADIRTVIHAGLPSTLEGYYQEIGRAGRDGKLSRTFLMHSYADQRTHDFFLTRDYPPADQLREVFTSLSDEAQITDELRAASTLSPEEFDKALEKLEIHGGARTDFAGNVRRGAAGWKKGYEAQAQFRAEQFAQVLRYIDRAQCRMAALVHHFGDVDDADTACGICDVCNPADAVLRQFRRAGYEERDNAGRIVDLLRAADAMAAGTIQKKLDLVHLTRDAYYALLGSLELAGMIGMEEAEFEKDGQVLKFRRVRLTPIGLQTRSERMPDLLISDGIVPEFAADASRVSAKKSSAKPAGASQKSRASNDEPVRLNPREEALALRMKEWRNAEAKKLGVPAYVVLHDRALHAIALARPANPRQLLEISGIGPAKAEKFGEAIFRLCSAAE